MKYKHRTKSYEEIKETLKDTGLYFLIQEIEHLQSENKRLNNVIGHYADRMSDIATKQKDLSKEVIQLTQEMFNA